MRRAAALAIVVGAAALAGPAAAQQPEPPPGAPAAAASDERNAAKELAQEGDQAFGAGRCDRAIGLWRKAEAKFHAPTILLRIARCQALMGKVVDAGATLEEIANDKLPPDAPAAFLEARDAAARELPGVQSRVATLEVKVAAGQLSVQPLVEVDERVQRGTRASFRLDPGAHRVRVRARDAIWERDVTLGDGESQTMEVALAEEHPAPPSRTQRYAGFVIGGVGVASVLVGAVFGFVAADTARELDRVCGADRKRCPPDQAGAVSDVKAQSLVADIALGGGAALVIAGAALVFFEPPAPPEAPRIRVIASALPQAQGAGPNLGLSAVGSF